ncbi:hypothetical protein DL96DRAFT_483864 [Flagelloscypha sp. PMI_526]|nr:hypothetical protein DL96DRAFT_483864 [Flagelloscypha sp. PMI_526]
MENSVQSIPKGSHEENSTASKFPTGSHSPPPPYSVTPPLLDNSEDALQQLKDYDTVILMDDSASMWNKWKEAGEALSSLVDVVAEYDSNGLDIYFFNDPTSKKNIRNKEEVEKLFRTVSPHFGTPMGVRIDALLKTYIQKLNQYPEYEMIKEPEGKRKWERENGELIHQLRPLNMIVITDGAPTDTPHNRPEAVIPRFAALLDEGDWPLMHVGIQFVQIGNDEAATEYLRVLDNNPHGIRDIVDTTPHHGAFTKETILEALIGGINRRVDRQGAKGVEVETS